MFETSLVLRFLSAKEKLLVFALLSKGWLHNIHKNYFWSEFPLLHSRGLRSSYVDFIDQFQELGGVNVQRYPGELLTPERL